MHTVTANAATRGRGRPRLASRMLIEDAAFELFLEQGYTRTSIDEIAQRSGVSRNTFFNYFHAKSDVFWVEIDAALAELPRHLAALPRELSVTEALTEAFTQSAETLAGDTVPWILSNFDTIGRPAEVMESAMQRLAHHSALLRTFVSERLHVSDRDLLPQLMTNTALAAVVSAALAWGQAGTQRENLVTYVRRALAPMSAGFAAVRNGTS